MAAVTAADLMADPIGNYRAAMVACFDPTRGELPRRQLDEEATVDYLQRLAAAGAEAVLIAASTGAGHLRTADELEQWLRVAAQADLGDVLTAALLRPEDGPADGRRLVEVAAECGYPLIYVRPGTNLTAGTDADAVAADLQPLVAMAAEAGMAVGLYSISDVSGVPLTADAASRVVQGSGGGAVVAVKVTEADYEQSTAQLLAHPDLKHLKIVQGWDPHLARALREGPRHDQRGRQRCAVTSGAMALAVYQYLHILAAAESGDWEEVGQAQQAVTGLFASMQDDPRRFADLQRAKWIMGLGQPLTAEVAPQQVERVFAALEALPRAADRARLARSLDLMQRGPYHDRLAQIVAAAGG